MFGFYAYLAMPLTGGFAALLLATLPGFFIYCRSSMSEISASALVVFAFMFAYLGLKEERRWKIYVSAAFLGLSLNIRMQSLFFAPLLLVMAFFPGAHSPALAASLRCTNNPFPAGGQPRAGAEHNRVSFAIQNGLRLLGPLGAK